MTETNNTNIETGKIKDKTVEKPGVTREKSMSWDELSEVLNKSDGFIYGENIKEITLINPKKIKFILERKT